MKKVKKNEPKIKKAIVPIAGLGTRFLPLSKMVPKEFFPIVDKPVIQYIVEEIRDSGISEIIFVLSSKEKKVLDYFKKSPEIEKTLEERNEGDILKELQRFEEEFKDIDFSYVIQKKPLGDGHAILKAEKEIGEEPVAVSFGDDIVDDKEPALSQLMNVFKTCNAPVVGLKSLPEEKLPSYGVVKAEKIANRFYKIKKIVEKPKKEETPSDLAVCGKYILTPEVFNYLKRAEPSQKGEIILGEVLDKLAEEGKVVYGYEMKGDWLECGDKEKWLKTFFHFALKDERFSEELKNYFNQKK